MLIEEKLVAAFNKGKFRLNDGDTDIIIKILKKLENVDDISERFPGWLDEITFKLEKIGSEFLSDYENALYGE